MNPELPTNPPPQEREELLFAAALERDEPARSAFLDEACRGNPALRRRLLALLTANERPNHDLNLPDESACPPWSTTSSALSYDGVGQTIGPYRLLEKIGEGGCGIVFAAEQMEPVRRQVAVKVLSGQASGTYVIEVSTNLIQWQTLQTIFTDATGRYTLLPAALEASPRRFYRARTP